MKHYICIEGNIGAGKSTLAQQISNKLAYLYLPEQFEENHLLPLFYKEPKKFSFPLEFSFLLNRFQQLCSWKEKLNKYPVVSDYYFEKCLYFAQLNLKPQEFLLFKEEYQKLNQHIIQPDLIIYLNLSTHYLQKNIKQRNREYETAIENSYLEKLNTIYSEAANQLKSISSITFTLTNNNIHTYNNIYAEIAAILTTGVPLNSIHIKL